MGKYSVFPMKQKLYIIEFDTKNFPHPRELTEDELVQLSNGNYPLASEDVIYTEQRLKYLFNRLKEIFY